MRMRVAIMFLLTLGLTWTQVARVAAEDRSTEASLDDEDEDDDEDDEDEDGDEQKAGADKGKDEAQAAAPAEPAAFSSPISLGLLLGYGFDLSNTFNFWGLGLGLRGGYNIGKIYIGGRLAYHFGESREDRALGVVIRNYSWHHLEVGFEGGYDLMPIERLTIRPELGLGFVNLTTYFRNTTTDTTDSKLAVYFALGASVLYDITPMFFVGGDTRLQIVVGSAATEGLTFLINGGVRL